MADQTQVDAITKTAPPPGTANGYVPSQSDQIMQQLQNTSGVISSSDQDIQAQYQDVIKQTQASGAAQTTAIENKYNPAISNQQISNQQRMETGLENNHGYGLNAGLLQTINKQNDDDLQMLIQERDSAVATGQAATAKNISDIMLQSIQDRMKNRQDVFNNMVSIAGVANQQQQTEISKGQLKIAQQQADVDMQAKMGTIALTYGIKVNAKDDISDVVNRAANNAKTLYDMNVQDAAASIRLKNGQAGLYNAQRDALAGKTVTDFKGFFSGLTLLSQQDQQTVTSSLLTSIATNPESIVNYSKALSDYKKPQAIPSPELAQQALSYRTQGVDLNTALGMMLSDSRIANKTKAEDMFRTIYGQPQTPNLIGLYAQAFVTNPFYDPFAIPVAQFMGVKPNLPFE